jgi:hypothetical protein
MDVGGGTGCGRVVSGHAVLTEGAVMIEEEAD